MDIDTCIYCGSDSLTYLHNKELVKHNCDIMHCQFCKVKFSSLEFRLVNSDTLLNSKPDFSVGDETSTLASAFGLMERQCWSEALYYLCRHT